MGKAKVNCIENMVAHSQKRRQKIRKKIENYFKLQKKKNSFWVGVSPWLKE